MFYDDVFHNITEKSPFSEKAILSVSVDNVIAEYELSGIFCSGSYGERELDKGYSLRKSIKRQTFKISKMSLPTEIEPSDIARQSIYVHGNSWVIREVVGNDSGILELDLVPGGQD